MTLSKQSKISNIFAKTTTVMAILFLLHSMVFWGGLWFNREYNTEISIENIVIGFIFTSFHMGLLAYSFFHIASLFKFFSKSEWINDNLSQIAKKIGFSLSIYALLSPFMRFYEFSIFMGEGGGFILPLKTNDVVLVVIGFLIIMLAVSLDKANIINKENNQIV